MNLKSSSRLLLLLAAGIGLACAANAALTAAVSEEWTGYTDNTNLNGFATNATGLTGNWAVANASAGVGVQNASGDLLSYNGFAPAGTISGGHTDPLNDYQKPTLSASLSSPISQELYFQYLFNFTFAPNGGGDTDIGIRMDVGSLGLGWYITDAGAASIFIGSGWGAGSTAAATLSINTTYLLVGKLTYAGGEFSTASLWLNPTGTAYDNITGSDASIINTDISSLDIPSLTSLSFTWEDRRAGSATKLGAVEVLVPEPSTYAILAGFAALGLVMYRRRRLR